MSEKQGVEIKPTPGEKSPAHGCVYVPTTKTGFDAILESLENADLKVEQKK